MPEETETETEQVEPQPSETESALEAPESEPETFDEARAKKALSKKNSENENLRKRLKELQPLAEKAKQLEDAQKSETERLNEQLTSAQERAAKAVRAAVASKVEALAAKEFADPEDAAGALDLASYVDDDGDIDTDTIRRDLTDLLKRKPHWARPDEGPRSPRPDRTQGSSGNGNRTSSDPGDIFAGLMNEALKGR